MDQTIVNAICDVVKVFGGAIIGLYAGVLKDQVAAKRRIVNVRRMLLVEVRENRKLFWHYWNGLFGGPASRGSDAKSLSDTFIHLPLPFLSSDVWHSLLSVLPDSVCRNESTLVHRVYSYYPDAISMLRDAMAGGITQGIWEMAGETAKAYVANLDALILSLEMSLDAAERSHSLDSIVAQDPEELPEEATQFAPAEETNDSPRGCQALAR